MAFYDEVIQIMKNVDLASIDSISQHIAEKIAGGGKFYIVGTGHSHMVAEEFYARAGGLACAYMMVPPEFTLIQHPLKSTQIERIAEYASVVLLQYPVSDKDVVMICSNSGRNALPVELALRIHEIGASIIALTNLAHSSSVQSRHPSGKKLYQVCDMVIDNCGVEGDATMEVPGVRGKMGSTSSIVCMYIAQMMSMGIAGHLTSLGVEAPVFLSANLDDGDRWNASIMKEYYNI